MSKFMSVEDASEEAHSRQDVLIINEGDKVRIIPLTPVVKEVAGTDRTRTQYRTTVFIPKNKKVKQLVLSDARMRSITNVCGDWTDIPSSVLFSCTGPTKAERRYSFTELVQGDTANKEYKEGMLLLAEREEEGWEEFREYAASWLTPVIDKADSIEPEEEAPV